MSDLPVPREKFLVSPSADVEKKWIQVAIAEKECRVKRLEIDKEEIMRAQTVKLDALVMMLKREIVELNNRLSALEPIDV